MQASMTVINGNLFLFGGRHLDILYNDLWIFNIEKNYWKLQSMSGEIPTPRFDHAVDSDGYAMVLFGGEDVSGLKNDLFIFNSLTFKWKMLTPKSDIIPKITKGACLVLRFPLVYIYGGKTNSGPSGDFWVFDIGSLEYTELPSF
ncbi:hypothetical protein SteCoe_36930 [Stentor coeruleus]|uniref:Uncharacterized protein n=1 Tax=Stentor coeruleus TaxID=5963 RepID=A0A1R2AP40_9CILI|nr:hypothetical protein SteCoe_36930 [Stentor coeruleus]